MIKIQLSVRLSAVTHPSKYSVSHYLCAPLSPAVPSISFCELYIKTAQILYMCSPNIYCQHLCVSQIFLSVCLSPAHRQTHRITYLLWFQPLSLGLGCGYRFRPLAFDHPVIFSPFISPSLLILHHISRPHFPTLVHTDGCGPPAGLLQSSPEVISRYLPGSRRGRGKGTERRRGGGTGWDGGDQPMSVCEKPPGVGNSPANSPLLPRVSSSVCTVSHTVRVSSSLSLPCYLLLFPPSPSFLTSPAPPLCPSVSLIILHCFTCNVVRH